jgi:energy-converting hydrogenase Eha subunit H
MRILIIFVAVIIYLFLLVFIESELVKIEVRKEVLKNKVVELRNNKKQLESDLIDIANLANIETAARAMGFFFPEQNDILGVVE